MNSTLLEIFENTKSIKDFNITFIEKDYYLSILLKKISENESLKHLLLFKWWTCIYRWYLDYYRWSEDLDFIIDSSKLYKFDSFNQWAAFDLWNWKMIIFIENEYKIIDIDQNNIDTIDFQWKKTKLINFDNLSKSAKSNLLNYLSKYISNTLFDNEYFHSYETSYSEERKFLNIFFWYNSLFDDTEWLKNWKVEIEISVKNLYLKQQEKQLYSLTNKNWITIFEWEIDINCLNIHEILWEKIWALFWRWRVNNYEKDWKPRIAIRDFFDVYMINKHEKELNKSSNFQWIYSDDVFNVLNNKLKNDIRRWFYFIDIKKHKDFIKEEIFRQKDLLLSLVYNKNDHWFFKEIDDLLDFLIQFQEKLKEKLWIYSDKDIHEWLFELYQNDTTNINDKI